MDLQGLVKVVGEVRVFSELGRGTTFEVILPNKINNTANGNIKNNKNIQNKMERCNIEFSDIYNQFNI